MTIITRVNPVLAAFHSTNEVVATSLPIDLPTNTWRTIMRVVLPVTGGDLLDVSSWFKVTSEAPYNVGVGAHLWGYDLDNGLGAAPENWFRLDGEAGSVGMNVTKDIHHLTLGVDVPFSVPVDWTEGHRIVIALRADAHSTAWDKDGNGKVDDHLEVDPYGRLTVRRYV